MSGFWNSFLFVLITASPLWLVALGICISWKADPKNATRQTIINACYSTALICLALDLWLASAQVDGWELVTTFAAIPLFWLPILLGAVLSVYSRKSNEVASFFGILIAQLIIFIVTWFLYIVIWLEVVVPLIDLFKTITIR